MEAVADFDCIRDEGGISADRIGIEHDKLAEFIAVDGSSKGVTIDEACRA